jgi:hypothetical protein
LLPPAPAGPRRTKEVRRKQQIDRAVADFDAWVCAAPT